MNQCWLHIWVYIWLQRRDLPVSNSRAWQTDWHMRRQFVQQHVCIYCISLTLWWCGGGGVRTGWKEGARRGWGLGGGGVNIVQLAGAVCGPYLTRHAATKVPRNYPGHVTSIRHVTRMKFFFLTEEYSVKTRKATGVPCSVSTAVRKGYQEKINSTPRW